MSYGVEGFPQGEADFDYFVVGEAIEKREGQRLTSDHFGNGEAGGGA